MSGCQASPPHPTLSWFLHPHPVTTGTNHSTTTTEPMSPYHTQMLVPGLCGGARATTLTLVHGNEGLFCLTGQHSPTCPTAGPGDFFTFSARGQNAALHFRWQEWANACRFPGPDGESAPLSNHTGFRRRTGKSLHIIIQLQTVQMWCFVHALIKPNPEISILII